jgi:hypothetical protein
VSFLDFAANDAMTAPMLPHSPSTDPALEDTLAAVETRLAALGEALRARDAAAIDSHATELHRALARAVDHFTRGGTVPPALRRRLASASGQVAAQRESLARATAALDRAIEVLMPRETPGLYSSLGAAERGLRGGSIQA